MRAIIESVTAQMKIFSEEARSTVDIRLKDFEDRLVAKFAKNPESRATAFSEPDFQYLVGRASISYARSGDDELGDALIDLISERSKHEKRTRLSLSLNEAIEKAPLLTENEFAELSMVYLIRYTKFLGINNKDRLADAINKHVIPLLDNVSREQSSYSYLESQSCAIQSIASVDLTRILHQLYGGLLSKGFVKSDIESLLPSELRDSLSDLIRPCLNNRQNLQFNALDNDVFRAECARLKIQLTEDVLATCWSFFEKSFLSKDEILTMLSPTIPRLGELFAFWDNSPIKSLTLTSVGLAIAHANAVRAVGFVADLAIWIR